MKLLTRSTSMLLRVVNFVREGRALSALSWKPRSFSSLKLNNRLAAVEPGLRTIFDCGANIGQFARAATETFPDAILYSFEPFNNPAEAFKRNLAQCNSVHLTQAAVGDYDGTLVFHTYSDTQLSSAFTLSREFRAAFQGVREEEVVEVPVLRLDSFAVGRQFPRPLLIKLDLQGYELNALKGAKKLLQETDFVLTEVALRPMYDGEPLFQDITSFLVTAGFGFQEPLAFLEDENGRIFQMDALFSRAK